MTGEQLERVQRAARLFHGARATLHTEILRGRREGVSLRALATAAGVSRETIRRWDTFADEQPIGRGDRAGS